MLSSLYKVSGVIMGLVIQQHAECNWFSIPEIHKQRHATSIMFLRTQAYLKSTSLAHFLTTAQRRVISVCLQCLLFHDLQQLKYTLLDLKMSALLLTPAFCCSAYTTISDCVLCFEVCHSVSPCSYALLLSTSHVLILDSAPLMG